jgi:hypothetical protein
MRVKWFVLGSLLTVSVSTAWAQDSVIAARERYAAAEYEEALAILDRLKAHADGPAGQRGIEQYRAYCLLALNRATAAEEAIAIVVTLDPLYQPSDGDASPRIRSAFKDVRRRMLASGVQGRYAAAKAAFDAKQWKTAVAGFTELLQVMEDPELQPLISQPPLSDLRTLASGFRDLSVQAATPPPIATVPQTPMAMPIGKNTRIYSADDARIVAPVAVRQVVPTVPEMASVTRPGILELIIDETGAVETAVIRASLGPRIDNALVEAAKRWTYRPATIDGAPVKYRKMMQVDVTKK